MNENMHPDVQTPRNDEVSFDGYEIRQGDRRKEPSEGYAYISMVGWFDRREQIRRKVDDDRF
jgi:hypothetical protein